MGADNAHDSTTICNHWWHDSKSVGCDIYRGKVTCIPLVLLSGYCFLWLAKFNVLQASFHISTLGVMRNLQLPFQSRHLTKWPSHRRLVNWLTDWLTIWEGINDRLQPYFVQKQQLTLREQTWLVFNNFILATHFPRWSFEFRRLKKPGTAFRKAFGRNFYKWKLYAL